MRKPLLIPKQIPEFLRTEYPAFVEFMQLYYEWLEQQQIGSIESLVDIDKTVDDFITYFRKEFDVNGVEYEFISPRLFLRKSKELFTAKGSEAAIKFLFRILYGKESEVITPWNYVLIPSWGKWYQDLSVFVTITKGSGEDLAGQFITIEGIDGRGYKTFVKAAAQVYNNVYQLYLDNFNVTKILYDCIFATDNNLINGTILRTTSAVNVVDGGYDFEVGQLFLIEGFSGKGSIVKVTAVNTLGTITGAEIIEFGLGYNTSFTTQIYPKDSITPQNIAQITLTYDADDDDNPDLVANYFTDDKLGNPAEAMLFTRHDYTGTAGAWTTVDADTIVEGAQYKITTARFNANEIIVGNEYKILTVGTTDFTALGAANNSVGTIFTATASGNSESGTGTVGLAVSTIGNVDYSKFTEISASQIIIGKQYKILSSGTTDFTEFGAIDSNVGTTFTATIRGDSESGSGTVGTVLDSVGDVFVATVSGSVNNKPITSLEYLSGTVTVGCVDHGYSPGDVVKILGVDPIGYNGKFIIVSTETDSFTFDLDLDPGVYVSGGYVAGFASVQALKSFFVDSTYVGDILAESQIQENHAVTTRLGAATLLLRIGGIIKYPGYYLDGESILSDLSYIQDSYRYQKFSYITAIEEELETYKQLLKNTLHPVGTQLLGEYRAVNNFSLTAVVDTQLNVLPTRGLISAASISDNLSISIDKYITDSLITSNPGGVYRPPYYYDIFEARYCDAGYLENETAFTN